MKMLGGVLNCLSATPGCPFALQHLRELRLSADNEVDPCSAQMSEATVMTAVEKALDAFDCHFKEQLEYTGTKLKLGRGGCYGPDRDRIESNAPTCLWCNVAPTRALTQPTRVVCQN